MAANFEHWYRNITHIRTHMSVNTNLPRRTKVTEDKKQPTIAFRSSRLVAWILNLENLFPATWPVAEERANTMSLASQLSPTNKEGPTDVDEKRLYHLSFKLGPYNVKR